MRLLLFIILLASFSYSQPEITRALDVSADVICPGNHLVLKAVDSAGNPAQNVELRLVLYYPYQGLVALGNTDQNGLLEFILTKTGTYRIYISTKNYNHAGFAEFQYPELCPPPSQPEFDISVEPDCIKKTVVISVSDNGPLKDVIITTDFWSSATSSTGKAIFPLEEGLLSIRAYLENYIEKNLSVEIDCRGPECTDNSQCAFNQICENETCFTLEGECGYAENHSWVFHECCNDGDCSGGGICENNSCIAEPEITEMLETETSEEQPAAEKQQVCIAFAMLLVLLLKIGWLKS